MRLIAFLTVFLLAANTLFAQVIYNPFVSGADITPKPMLPVEYNGTGTFSFNVGNTGTSAISVVAGQELTLVISLSMGEATLPGDASVGGTGKSLFDWSYEVTTKTYTATQKQIIPANSSYTITIAYKVTANSPEGNNASNGFNVNLQPPAYTNGTDGNRTSDDRTNLYTFVLATDFGDAPLSYGEAKHKIGIYKSGGNYTNYVFLGATVDHEAANQPSADATGDGTDEDGVTFPLQMYQGQSITIPVAITKNQAANVANTRLKAWIDWNGDGTFEVTGAELIYNLTYTSGPNVSMSVSIPDDADISKPIFARFRIGASGTPFPTLGPTGSCEWGEVEDYKIQILAAQADLMVTKTAPAEVDGGSSLSYNITVKNNGPSPANNVRVTDVINTNFTLGTVTPPGTTNWNVSAGTGTWTIGKMTVGQEITLTLTGTVSINQCSTLTNTAVVASDTPEPTPDPTSNSSTATTTVKDVTKPTIMQCAQARDFYGCNTDAIAGPAFSETKVSYPNTAMFINPDNNGIASDNCGITEVSYIDVIDATSTSCPLSVTRTWTIKDAAGKIETCQQKLQVIDNVKPSITSCGTKQTAYANASCQAAVPNMTGSVVATDACTAQGLLTKTQLPAAGSFVGQGVHTITVTVKDECGNENTCTVEFEVLNPSVSGTVFNDTDGTTDSAIDGTGIGTAGTSQLYVNAVSVATGNVVGSVPVNNTNGSYSLNCSNGVVANTSYTLVLSKTQGTIGQPVTALLPLGWVNTAETEAPVTADGTITPVSLVTTSLTGLNFGIEQIPTAGNGTATLQNPGGTNNATVPATAFTNVAVSTDQSPGTVTSIRITSFPANITSITINGTNYTSGNWPISTGVTLPTNGTGQPTVPVLIDPIDGTPTVTIPFVAIDNAGKESGNTGNAVITFTDLIIAGNVFNDMTNDGTVNGTGTNASGNLYMNLVTSGSLVASIPVTSGGTYSFGTTNGVKINTTYSLILTKDLQITAPPASTKPNYWVSTGEHVGTGPGTDGTADGILTVGTSSGSVANANFGIKQVPDLSPVVTASKNVLNDQDPINLYVQISELNNISTDGTTITFTLKVDSRITDIVYPTSSGTLGSKTIQNGDWILESINTVSGEKILTFKSKTAVIIGNSGNSTIGISGKFVSTAQNGSFTVTTTINNDFSGGEVRFDNNVDSESLDYFTY